MTDQNLPPLGTRVRRVIAGLVVASALLHMSTASALPGGDDLPAADEQNLVDPAIVAGVGLGDAETSLDAGEDEADEAGSVLGAGLASYYGAELAGRRTASGERFNPRELTAAHRTLPFGSKVRVTNPANGRSVVVRINDRGPFTHNRLIDLSRSAAERIGLVARGHGHVELALLGE